MIKVHIFYFKQGGIELGGIYVKTMAPDGSAALSGKISIGEYLFLATYEYKNPID